MDIYRYCWDGAVLSEGVSPFRYSPMRVLLAQPDEANLSPELKRLIALREANSGIASILETVHFGELTTIYPPVSQLVFAAANCVTPKDASVRLRLFVMKTFIVVFDLLTLACLAMMLARLKLDYAWAIPYAWSPLLVKEFANSGHLDSIAVFFCTAAVFSFTEGFGRAKDTRLANVPWLISSAILLALGVGAKLYPVVLAPLLAWILLRHCGWRNSIVWSTCFGSTALLFLAPMLFEMRSEVPDARPDFVALNFVATSPPILPESGLLESAPVVPFALDESFPPLPSSTEYNLTPNNVVPGEALASSQDLVPTKPNDDGLVEFLARWEMNDLLFMVIEENLRTKFSSRSKPWFVLTSDLWRAAVAESFQANFGWQLGKTPFFLTRAITLSAFFCLVVVIALKTSAAVRTQGSREERLSAIFEGVFWVLAWFWLLSPTQNPWYWSWCLPFVAFARNRVWLAVGGLVVAYYLRFWFLYQFGQQEVWGSGYIGTDFFDFVVVWIEYAPWMAVLAVSWIWSHARSQH